MNPEIRHLYLSPGHNFYGRHGLEPGTHPMLEQEEIQCLAGRGIEGDRFLDYRPDFKGQVTFFDWAVYEAVREHFALPGLPPSVFRRNILVHGLDLHSLIGKTFTIQGVEFLGTQESSPCEWMNRVVAEGAEQFLQNRGGLRAKILTTGTLRRGS